MIDRSTSIRGALRKRQRGFLLNPYRFGVAGADPHWANVVILLRGEGTDGSGIVYDEVSATNLKSTNNPTVSTAQYKFGAASLYAPGGGAFTALGTYKSAYDIGSGDFTVECWARSANVSSIRYIFMQPHSGGYSSGGWSLAQNASGIPYFIYADGSAEYYVGGSASSNPVSLSVNTWHHIAATLVVEGSDRRLRIFVDGVLLDNVVRTGVPANGNTNPSLMRDINTGTRSWNGYVDEFRITKGVARYTAAFTPPAAQFPNF